MSQLDEPPFPRLFRAAGDLPRVQGIGISDAAVSARPLDESGLRTPSLADVVARASGRMLPEQTIDRLLDLMTSTAVQVVGTACGAGVTVAAGAGGVHHVTTAATDPLVEHLDRLQYELDEGPCMTAWGNRSTVRVEDLETDPRWPRWSAEARNAGVRSVLSAPLVAGDHVLGALKLYAHVPHAFRDADVQAAAMFAAQGAVLIDAAASVRSAGHVGAELREVLRRRELVSQATGIVMARDRVPAAAAFAHLVAASRREQRSVHDVAHRLVTTVTKGR